MRDPRAAVLAFARSHPSPTRATWRRRRALLALAAVLWAGGVVLVMGGVELDPRPGWLAALTGLAALAVMGWAVRLVGSTTGQTRASLTAVVVGAPLALLAWKLGVTSFADGMSDPFPGRLGDRCFRVALVGGAGPFLALVWARRRTVTSAVRATGAAIGCAAGTVAWMVNDIRCQVGEPVHLLVGHVGPLVIFIALGDLCARVLSPRSIH